MQFQPIKQINAILEQEYFEPTIAWAFRVVLALNVPLLVLPLFTGFTAEVTWAAFGAYMLSLVDYRGLHANKIVIQSLEALLIFLAGMAGMVLASSLWLSVAAMFVIGMLAALIRNWSNYGTSIGVGIGFFFLFGLSNPRPPEEALQFGLYALIGSGWAILITLVSFPLRPASPVKRSVAKIWKANTELLDAMVEQLVSAGEKKQDSVLEKEIAVRAAINQSLELFTSRHPKNRKGKAQHYDMLMELRRTAAQFGAMLTSLQEESDVLNSKGLAELRTSTTYKMLSALAQASARMAIVIFTLRPEDLTLARVRVKRCDIALGIFREACLPLNLGDRERIALRHYTDTLDRACGCLQLGLSQIEAKLQFRKSDYLENYRLSFNNFVAGLKPDSLNSFARNALAINSQQFRYALRVAFVLALGVFLYKYFHINHGHWIPLTIMIVIQPYYGATLKKGIERITGTVAGIVLGGLIMLLPLPHEAFLGLLIVVSFCVAYFLRNNYKVGVFFVTIMMVVLMQLSQQATWALIGWRVLSTLIGAVLAVAAGYALWPVWEKERFPALMKASLQQNTQYLRQVLRFFNKTLPPDESWQRYRRVAEAANNDVFACVQRMQDEPEHIRDDVSAYYALAGVNIRMSREVTSIGLIADEHKDTAYAAGLNAYLDAVTAIMSGLAEYFSDQGEPLKQPDFANAKSALSSISFENKEALHLIRSELEKILFELETMCALLKPQEASQVIIQRA